MSNNSKLFSAMFLAGIVTLSGCSLKQMVKMAADQKLTVTPSPLELHGDSVKFDMAANLPIKMLKKNTIYTVNTYYKFGNPVEGSTGSTGDAGKIEVGQMSFVQTDFPDNKTGEAAMKKSFSFLYQDAHMYGDVVIKGVASKGSKAKETAELPVGKGVATTSRLVQPTFYVNYMPHNYVYKEEYEPENVEFFFDKGKSELNKKEKASDRATMLKGYVAAKKPTKSVTVVGSHSPEGTTAINTKLSGERSQVIEDYYKTVMTEYDYKDEAKDMSFVKKPVVQDWTEFKKILKDYDKLTDAEKNEILAIIDGDGEFVAKELRLQKLKSYKKVMKEVYPKLRVAKTEMLKIKMKLTEAEIVVLGQKIGKGTEDASKLQDDELLYAAAKTPDLNEKEEIYKALIKKSDGYVAYNNLGAGYMSMAQTEPNQAKKMAWLDKAATQLELSIKKQESSHAYANMAGVKLMKGDQEGAMKAVEKATALGASGTIATSLNAIKGYGSILKGDYPAAITAFTAAGNNPVVLYNKALANLLSKQYDMAVAGFDEAIKADDKNALTHYCAAVTAARKGEEEKMSQFLTKALDLDSSLKSRAVKDVEFFKFWEKDSFKNALK